MENGYVERESLQAPFWANLTVLLARTYCRLPHPPIEILRRTNVPAAGKFRERANPLFGDRSSDCTEAYLQDNLQDK
jgi:hypothetical protein